MIRTDSVHRQPAIRGERDGVRFRELHAFTAKLATLPLGKLSMETAKDYDVVIVDWVSQYGNDGYDKRERSLFNAPKALGGDFTKPFIAMTYVGTQVRGGYKLDWL